MTLEFKVQGIPLIFCHMFAQEENGELDSENRELRGRLEAAQQRLELAVSRSAFAAAAAAQLPPQPPGGTGGASSGAAPAAERQLFTESAPTTPAPAPRRPLRAPKGAPNLERPVLLNY